MFYESYYGIAPLGQELSHHGIKGQKWGIRRFQNEDGSLTPAGRERYGYDDDIVLKKGTRVSRYANDEPLDSKRKYVSLAGSMDDEDYHNSAIEGALAMDYGKEGYRYEYELSKDVKVASARQLTDVIIEKYGDKKLRDIDNYYKVNSYFKKIKDKKIKDIYNYDDLAKSRLSNDDYLSDTFSSLSRSILYESTSSDVFKELSKRGYDAIIDAEDYWAGFVDMPLIMLNPQESMRLSKKESMWHSEDYLMHYGVKGMKHGVRQWQYPDGSLTPAGYVHYGYGKKKTSGGGKQSKFKKAQTSMLMKAYTKAKLSDAVKGSGIGKKYADTFLKANTPLYRIQSSDQFENFAFYATYKKHDIDEYAGLFGKNLISRANAEAKRAKKTGAENASELAENANNMEIFQLKLNSTSKLKIPSDENAGHIVGKLLKDSQFHEDLGAAISDSASKMKRPSQQILLKEASSLLRKDQSRLSNSDKIILYKALNLSLTNHNEQEVRMQNKFYVELKKLGYSALLDLNDKSYSSYHAKSPVIVFNTDNVKLQSVTKMDPAKIEKLYKKHNFERTVKDIPEQIAGNLAKTGSMKISSITGQVTDAMFEYLKHADEDYLMHYGVKGQKWGERRWQYEDGSLTPEGYVHYGYGKTTSADRERMNGKQYTSKESNADNLKHFAELHPIEALSKIEKLSDEDFKSLSDTDLTMEFNPIRDNINNPVGEDNYTGRSYNCPNCAVAFEMTERGYAVSARPKPNGSNVEDIESFFKGGALVKFDAEGLSKEALDIMRESDKAWNEALKNGKDPWNDPKARELDEKADKVLVETYKRINNKIEETLKAQGEGARGIMVAGWIGNYGWSNIDERTNAFHAFNYKVTKNGVQFHDVEGRREHEHNGSYDGWKGEYDPRDIYFMRTDNLELNDNVGEAVYSHPIRRKSA